MAKFYIDPLGVDSVGRNGSIGQEWRTLTYAITRVYTAGDIIHANAGTYNLPSQVKMPIGVSLEGDGYNTLFNCTVSSVNLWTNSGFAILFDSYPLTYGYQSVSYIRMNGVSIAGYGAVGVWYRSDVNIHHCTFENFSHWGVRYYGGEPPAGDIYYIRGANFYSNTMSNCGGYFSGTCLASLGIGGVDGMWIHDNTILTTRDADPIMGVEGFVRNTLIYNNTLSKTFVPGISHWDFAIEIWNWEGGNEIYNNVITGSIDVVLACF
jgi:hypothetical protein